MTQNHPHQQPLGQASPRRGRAKPPLGEVSVVQRMLTMLNLLFRQLRGQVSLPRGRANRRRGHR